MDATWVFFYRADLSIRKLKQTAYEANIRFREVSGKFWVKIIYPITFKAGANIPSIKIRQLLIVSSSTVGPSNSVYIRLISREKDGERQIYLLVL